MSCWIVKVISFTIQGSWSVMLNYNKCSTIICYIHYNFSFMHIVSKNMTCTILTTFCIRTNTVHCCTLVTMAKLQCTLVNWSLLSWSAALVHVQLGSTDTANWILWYMKKIWKNHRISLKAKLCLCEFDSSSSTVHSYGNYQQYWQNVWLLLAADGKEL